MGSIARKANVNKRVIGDMIFVTKQAAIKVIKSTEGVIDYDTTSRDDLEATLDLVNNVIEHELNRRFGE